MKTDVFGKALEGYLNKASLQYIVRGEDGFLNILDIGTYFTDYLDWKDYEKSIITRYAQGKVLDIGAGAGRHSLFLQNRGFEVHAIDISPLALEIMKRRGIKNVHLMDLRKMKFPDNYFDSVLIMFADLGLGGTIKDTKKLLKNLYRITNLRGRIITTIRNPYDNNSEYFWGYEQKRKRAKTVEKIKARIEYNGETGNWFFLLMASPEELRSLIKGTGWIISKIIKGDDGFYGALLEKELWRKTFPIKVRLIQD